MGNSKGMATTLTRKRATPGRRGGVVEAMKSRAAAVGETRMIPVGDIQPNPDNPSQRSEPGEGLVASIREVGVIQDLVLAPAEQWRTTHPEHADTLTDAPYVVLAGHRRLAAAVAAERDEVPARVRDDFDATTLDSVVLHENVHREALSPVEEALAYRRLLDRQQISQRALAKHTGVSQSQISKKLKLLDLPAGLQEAVSAGLVGIEDGSTILQEDEEVVTALDALVQAAEDRVDLTVLIPEARRAVQVQVAATAAATQAEERGAPFVTPDHLAEHLGSQRVWEHRLSDDKAIATAQAAGTLVVSHGTVHPWGGGGKVEFYSTETPAPPKRATQPRTASDTQRRKANKARREAMLEIVTTPPKADVIHRCLLQWALTGAAWGSDTLRVAQPLLEHADLIPGDLNYYEVREHLTGLADKPSLHAAWVLYVAKRDEEVGLPQDYRTWGALHLEHYAWLVEHGYEPTPWELEKLDEARQATETTEEEK